MIEEGINRGQTEKWKEWKDVVAENLSWIIFQRMIEEGINLEQTEKWNEWKDAENLSESSVHANN